MRREETNDNVLSSTHRKSQRVLSFNIIVLYYDNIMLYHGVVIKLTENLSK